MDRRILRSLIVTALALAAVGAASRAARAEVTGVVLTHCVDILGSKSFGRTGAYEKCFARSSSHSTRTAPATGASWISTRRRVTRTAWWSSRPTCSFFGPRTSMGGSNRGQHPRAGR